ncbi:hypothetical protein H4219_002621 [Mycoemilia scoparia]|uniref:Tetraspanin n=1 Tax=Mycoemilia scoparia TaxID=417184 RepID=A0A9W8DNV7_9FUNG|nr:hypothetical protein H4219_002621 [Mycoemilia scoparia]
MGYDGSFGLVSRHLAMSTLLLIILFICEIILLVAGYSRNRNADSYLDRKWGSLYIKRPGVLRLIEETYGCCGYNAPLDRAIPKSSKAACADNDFLGYSVGCREMLLSGYHHYRTVVFGWMLALVIIQIVSLIFALAIVKQVQENEDDAPIGSQRYNQDAGGENTRLIGPENQRQN